MSLTEPLASPLASAQRFDRLDALRGLAVVWMAVFHFCFDLNQKGLLSPPQQFLSDPFWTWQRTAIVSMFLLCAGMGQAVALQACQPWSRFWRRWGQVAGCALLVSAGSAWMFPHSWIHFGVLHGLAVMILLLRVCWPLLRKLGALGLAGIGVLALALPQWVAVAALNGRWGNWTGLVTRLPVTQDYVPVFPWLGVMLWGLALGLYLQRQQPQAWAGPLPHWAQALAVLGRWSLSFYMLHQPILIGVIALALACC